MVVRLAAAVVAARLAVAAVAVAVVAVAAVAVEGGNHESHTKHPIVALRS